MYPVSEGERQSRTIKVTKNSQALKMGENVSRMFEGFKGVLVEWDPE